MKKQENKEISRDRALWEDFVTKNNIKKKIHSIITKK